MSVDRLDALIITNLGDLDVAANRLQNVIGEKIGKKIDEITEAWCKRRNWEGKFEWAENDDLWVNPREWKLREANDSWLACFYFYVGAGDTSDQKLEEDFFWLTRLCKAGRGQVGFRWKKEDGLGAGKPAWRKFVAPYIETLRNAGWTYEDGSFFRPVRVEKEALADALVNDTIETALGPFKDTLDRLFETKPLFDQVIDAAKKHFGV